MTFDYQHIIIDNAGVIFFFFFLSQLRKLSFPYTCEESLDLSKELDGFEDIKSSSLVNVKTTIRERGIDTYLLKFEIL